MSGRPAATPIRFDASLHRVDRSTILRLPARASSRLPSRGQVSIQGTIDGHEFSAVLEPDGAGGHWMKVEPALQSAGAFSAGDRVTLEIAPTRDWPEPDVPRDLAAALAAAPQSIQRLWGEITPMARWEWVRWVNATSNRDTRRRRVEVSVSKLKNGKRRPCCFNLASCTDPELARNGRLVETA